MLGSLKLTKRKLGKEVSLESVLSPRNLNKHSKKAFTVKYDNISTWYFKVLLGWPSASVCWSTFISFLPFWYVWYNPSVSSLWKACQFQRQTHLLARNRFHLHVPEKPGETAQQKALRALSTSLANCLTWWEDSGRLREEKFKSILY